MLLFKTGVPGLGLFVDEVDAIADDVQIGSDIAVIFANRLVL